MIFLSASIPDPKRNEKYFNSADVIAIRDAVRALTTVVLPKSYLVWGGHPAITPLIRYVMSALELNVQDHITLYQSEYFRELFPADNKYFENVIVTPRLADRDDSLYEMRLKMFRDNQFRAGIFIGGMEGVEIEYDMFREIHPSAKIFPIASTGAAAKFIYERMDERPDKRLLEDYAYMALFRSLFETIIN
jgi:hypothetical protein